MSHHGHPGKKLLAAVREMALFHAARSPDLAAVYRRRGFDPKTIRTEKDLERVPRSA